MFVTFVTVVSHYGSCGADDLEIRGISLLIDSILLSLLIDIFFAWITAAFHSDLPHVWYRLIFVLMSHIHATQVRDEVTRLIRTVSNLTHTCDTPT